MQREGIGRVIKEGSGDRVLGGSRKKLRQIGQGRLPSSPLGVLGLEQMQGMKFLVSLLLLLFAR